MQSLGTKNGLKNVLNYIFPHCKSFWRGVGNGISKPARMKIKANLCPPPLHPVPVLWVCTCPCAMQTCQ